MVDQVFSRSRFFLVRDINFHERFKGHGQVCRLLKKELPLPRQSVLLGGKPPFQLLLLHTLPVLKVEGSVPCALFAVLVGWHPITPPCPVDFLLIVPPAYPASYGRVAFGLQFLVPLGDHLVRQTLGDVQFLCQLVCLDKNAVCHFLSFPCRFHFGAASSSLTSGRHIPFAVLCRPLLERSLPFGRSWRFGSVWRSFNFTKHFCLSFCALIILNTFR